MDKGKLTKILKNITSLVVIIAMFVIIFYQNRDRDVFKFGQNESDKLNTTKSNSISGFTSGTIGNLGDKGVALLTSTSYGVYNKEGESKVKNIAFSQPTLHTEGTYAVCYEPESTRVSVFEGSSEIYNLESENKIFLAKINASGYLFLATEKSGYNCECLVYNRSGEPIFKWDISKSEFIDGDLNCENDAIILSLVSSNEKKLAGEILQINITNAKIIKRNYYDSNVFFSINFNDNNTYVALGDKCLKYYNTDGTEKWTYNYNGKKLLTADISNHNLMVLAFSGSGEMYDGNFTEMKIINKLGQQIGERIFAGNVSEVSAGTTCAAIAMDKKVYFYGAKFEEKKVVKTDYSIKKVELFSDDEHAFVLGSSSGDIIN